MSPGELLQEAIRQGWRVRQIKAGWMVFPRDKGKPPVTIHRTPSDHRTTKNTYHDMIRSGLRKEK